MKTVIAALSLVIAANAAVALPSVTVDLVHAARGFESAARLINLTNRGIITEEQAVFAAQHIAERELNRLHGKINAANAVSETTTSDIASTRRIGLTGPGSVNRSDVTIHTDSDNRINRIDLLNRNKYDGWIEFNVSLSQPIADIAAQIDYAIEDALEKACLLYTSPSPRD